MSSKWFKCRIVPGEIVNGRIYSQSHVNLILDKLNDYMISHEGYVQTYSNIVEEHDTSIIDLTKVIGRIIDFKYENNLIEVNIEKYIDRNKLFDSLKDNLRLSTVFIGSTYRNEDNHEFVKDDAEFIYFYLTMDSNTIYQ